ncbi:MAG: ABC transporter permease [Candidatus Bathyarchaeota archaeon]|nr:ABC transporter permease [Candidatus Bathyarchaeota archaeon]
MAGSLTIAEKELKDQIGSTRFIAIFALMVLLSVLAAYQGSDYIKSNTEASFVYIFSGTQMSFSFIQIMVMFGPILGMAFGFDAINKERTTGTLSMLLGQPIYRDSVINGKFIAGAASLATLGIGTIAITTGLAIPMLGYGPSLTEALKILTLALLTVLYLVFWLSLGTLFSVVAKKTSTSILFSIATWMFFSIILSILASALVNIIVPMDTDMFIVSDTTDTEGGGPGGAGRFQMTDEFREAMERRTELNNLIMKISPTDLYSDTAGAILGTARGFNIGGMGFDRTVSLGEALMNNWANIVILAVGLVVCFAASYMLFLRTEIRPGD